MTTLVKVEREFLEEQREEMQESFDHAMKKMARRVRKGDPYATKQYVWQNQVDDAQAILHMLFTMQLVFISVIKQPKLGCNGLMFELIRLVCTHNNDDTYIPPENVYILTGMSNTEWVDTIKEDCPDIVRDNVYHRPKIGGKGKDALSISELKGKKNLLLIIDEVDVATKAQKKKQTIHMALEAAGILDMNYMRENNVRIVAISATICKELRAMKKFGSEYADSYTMTKPREYFGVEDMQDRGILKQAPPIRSVVQMERFIKTNGIEHFGENDPRVHIVRGTKKTRDFVQGACDNLGIKMYDHEHHSKLSHDDLKSIFLTRKHVVIFLKNMFGRADYIPNEMKVKIGFWLDKHVSENSRNANVQLQAGIGRMSGFYKSVVEAGHTMGYIFTNLSSVREYIAFYNNPSLANVQCHKSQPIFQPKYVKNADEVKEISRLTNDLLVRGEDSYRVYQSENDINEAIQLMGYQNRDVQRVRDKNGFIVAKLEDGHGVRAHHVTTVIDVIRAGKAYFHNGTGAERKKGWRVKYPCYLDLNNPSQSPVWVLQIKPGDEFKLRTLDQAYPDHLKNLNITFNEFNN